MCALSGPSRAITALVCGDRVLQLLAWLCNSVGHVFFWEQSLLSKDPDNSQIRVPSTHRLVGIETASTGRILEVLGLGWTCYLLAV